MQIITLDFETYYDDTYTLKKLTTEAYVRDPRFEVLCCALRTPSGNLLTVPGPELDKATLQGLTDWKDTAVLCHHAQFDGLIMSHHFGITPGAWLDTLSMARLVIGNHLPVGLEALAKHFNLGGKTVPYKAFRGLHWDELSPLIQRELRYGCAQDVSLTWEIFTRLWPGFPPEEIRLIDMTVRMFTEPSLCGDIELLKEVWMAEAARKEIWLRELEVRPNELQSAEKFAELLREAGVEPALKRPGINGMPLYAFAKNDKFMLDLVESADPHVAMLAQARLGYKSTLTQRRAERLELMTRRGPLTPYYKYCGSHTPRWSGGDKTNFQNFNRKGDLRKTIVAPPGRKLAIVDLSQIECRLLNTLAGQWDVVEKFRRGEDPYIGIASHFYKRPITVADKYERGMGKQGELMCGFGCGGPRFKQVASMGNYGPPIEITLEEGNQFVALYRDTHKAVVAYWHAADEVLRVLLQNLVCDWGPLQVRHKRIFLPNGMAMQYNLLEHEGMLLRRTRFGGQKIYGAKLVENVVQALARVIFGQALLRVQEDYRLLPAMISHDEAVYVVAAVCDDELLRHNLLDAFTAPVAWLPELPLGAECVIAERYGK